MPLQGGVVLQRHEPLGDGRRWRLLADGDFESSSQECDCHGQIVADHAADVDPDDCNVLMPDEAAALSCQDPRIAVFGVSTRAYVWEYLEKGGRPRPDCKRCAGDGCVEWPTGEWAIYEEVTP